MNCNSITADIKNDEERIDWVEMFWLENYHVNCSHYKHSVEKTFEATELYYAIVDCTTYGNISSISLPCHVSIFVHRKLSGIWTDIGHKVDS